MEIRSSAFFIGAPIPFKYTCDGENISPPLNWEAPPQGTQSFAVVVEDWDAPQHNFTHWVLYNLPANCHELPENIGHRAILANRGMQGKNDSDRIGFLPPCPLEGTHRYFFKVFALDSKINLQPGASKQKLLQAIEGHVLDAAEVMGRYTRSN